MSLRVQLLIVLGVFFAQVGHSQPMEITEKTLSVDRMFVDAKKAVFIGAEEQAIALYQQILELQPANAVAAFELSKAYLSIDSFVNALDRINYALGHDPSNKWFLLTKIDILKKSDDHTGIIESYKALLQLEPENPDFNRALAFAYVQNDQLKEAVDAFDAMEAKYGVLKNISLIKHDLYKQLGKDKQAEEELLDLVEAYPENVDFQYHLARYYMDEGRESEAENWYRNMLKLAPEDSRATIALAQFGNAYGSTDYLRTIRPVLRDPSADIELKIKELMPYVVDLQVTPDATRTEGLVQACRDLVEAHPNEAKAHAMLGDVLSLSGASEGAISAYTKTVALDPSNYIVWEQLCVLLKQTGDYTTLGAKADEGLIYFPNQPLLYYFLGNADYMLGAAEKAQNNYAYALNLAANKAEVLFNVHTAMASAYVDLNDMEAANGSFQKAFDIQNEHPFLHLDYAYFLLSSDKHDVAKKHIDIASKLLRKHPLLDAVVLLYQAKSGQSTNAEPALLALTDASTTDPIIFEICGDVYRQLDNTEKALDAYKQAAALGKKNKGLLAKIEDLQ